jgi:hypothetical protein
VIGVIERRAEATSRALWGAGGLLVVLGQLVLPFMSPTLMAGRGGSTVWDFPTSFTMGADGSVPRQVANRLTDLWLNPGAVIITVLVVAVTVAAIAGWVPRAVPALAGWVAALWQVGAFLTLVTAADWIRTPRPGLGLLATITGAILLSAPLLTRSPKTALPDPDPGRAALAGET